MCSLLAYIYLLTFLNSLAWSCPVNEITVSLDILNTDDVWYDLLNDSSKEGGQVASSSDSNHTSEHDTNKKVSSAQYVNLRPIIGILSQDLSASSKESLRNYTSYIAASYVKYVEAAGARVVPIMINKSEAYYKKMVSSLNGVLFPGGSVPINDSSGYGRAGRMLFELNTMNQESKEHRIIPIWGTCLGFEMVVSLLAGKHYPLTECSGYNRADNVTLVEGWQTSKMFRNVPEEVVKDLTSSSSTSNFHRKCVTPKMFENLGLNKTLQILATSEDDNGTLYVAMVEHRHLPVFGTQWHPEKPQFEWGTRPGHGNIPHNPESILIGQFMANFFVNEARKNPNHFDSEEEEDVHLIYNYKPVYTNPYGSSFVQCYYF